MTRENVLANPRVTLYLVHPVTLARYRIAARYLRTETAGPLFESMKAKLAGIASHTGMSGVFRLQGADIYHVLEIRRVDGVRQLTPPPTRNLLAAVRAAGQTIAQCTELVWQLRGTAELRQVEGAKVELQHNLGLGGACVVLASVMLIY